MSQSSPRELAEFLIRNQFLSLPQQELLERDKGRYSTTQELLKEVSANGWITPFQEKMLQAGHGSRLLVSKYRLQEQLGEGGMGVVYKAWDHRLDRLVAIKIIRPQLLTMRPELIHRFHREAKAVAQLLHPNVVILYDAGEDLGTHYLAMELVEGMTLEKMVRMHGALPIKQAADYMRQAALGLQHAYEQGLVHRDVKPSNLLIAQKPTGPGRRSSSIVRNRGLVTQRDKMLSQERNAIRSANQWGVLKILDMGLARLHESLDDQSSVPLTPLTRVGALLGTPDFIAPEQAKDARNVDIRADLYSLGCTFYFLLTGQPPFPNLTDVQKILKHQTEWPVGIDELRPHVPTTIIQIVRKLMQKTPDLRYEIPQDLADDLQRFLLSASSPSISSPQALIPTVNEMNITETPEAANKSPKGATGTKSEIVSFVPSKPLLFPFVSTKDSNESIATGASNEHTQIAGEGQLPKKVARIHSMLAHQGLVSSVALSSDGKFAATGGIDGRIRVWDLSSTGPKEVTSTLRPNFEIEVIRFHPNTGAIAIGGVQSGNAVIWMWDWKEDAVQDWGVFATSVQGGVGAANFSPDAAMFAVGVGSFVVSWKMQSNQATNRTVAKGHTYPVKALCFSPDSKLLASGGEGKNARIWTFGRVGASMKIKLEGHGDNVTSVDFSPDGKYFASGSLDRSVMIWDLSNPVENPKLKLNEHASGIRLIRFLPDSKHLLAICDNGQMLTWEIETGRPVSECRLESGVLYSIAISHNLGTVIVGYSDGRVGFYNVELSEISPPSRPTLVG
jgi:serine/threonine protein kinase